MQFVTQKRKHPPSVIIVSLIDVLIVVLIFLMVTTTFKQQPAIKLTLPESRQPKSGAAEKENVLIVTVPKQGPIYLKTEPVTWDTLQERLTEAVRQNPQTTLAVRVDTDTPVGLLVKVMDAAKAANIKVPPSLFTRSTH